MESDALFSEICVSTILAAIRCALYWHFPRIFNVTKVNEVDPSKMEALLTCLFSLMSPDNQQEVKGSGDARLPN